MLTFINGLLAHNVDMDQCFPISFASTLDFNAVDAHKDLTQTREV